MRLSNVIVSPYNAPVEPHNALVQRRNVPVEACNALVRRRNVLVESHNAPVRRESFALMFAHDIFCQKLTKGQTRIEGRDTFINRVRRRIEHHLVFSYSETPTRSRLGTGFVFVLNVFLLLFGENGFGGVGDAFLYIFAWRLHRMMVAGVVEV